MYRSKIRVLMGRLVVSVTERLKNGTIVTVVVVMLLALLMMLMVGVDWVTDLVGL